MQAPPDPLTVAEYLRLDEGAEIKYEYHAGQVFAMAGAGLDHNRLVSALLRNLGNRLSECDVLASDQRVHVESEAHTYTYPDVVVLCDEPKLTGDRPDTLINPVLLVEVTSESTEHNDRGWKLQAYTQIPSLQEYWIVDTVEPMVQRYVRRGDLWAFEAAQRLDAVIESALFSPTLPLSEIYAHLLS